MKDLKINKELMSAVLGHNDICNERIIQNKLLYMCKNDGMWDYEYEYNIYEFAFKCKEWAFARNYSIMSREAREYDICSPSVYKQVGLCNILVNDNPNVSKGIFVDNTEIEAIIKACEWVLSEVYK